MIRREAKPERMSAFLDGVLAVVITILVFELKPPHTANFAAFVSLWPPAISYAVSYLFIAIVWVNHHHLLRYAEFATGRLIWGNFVHVFAVSLMPFATAWIADTDLGGVPVSVYACLFVLMNATCLVLCWEAVDRAGLHDVTSRVRMMMRIRSLITLGLFTTAGVIALDHPIAGMALIGVCLVIYVRPEALGIKT